MIFDNLHAMVRDSLTQLGWFDAGRRHQPVTIAVEQQDVSTQVPVNTLAISDENVSSTLFEVGSQLSEDTRFYYVDFFGESDAVAKHIIGDVRDILLGKLTVVGRDSPTLQVYDLRMPTPARLFGCDILAVNVDRSHDFSHPWLRHWFSVQFTIVDYYGNDADAGPSGGG
jgi:hypothetical protein